MKRRFDMPQNPIDIEKSSRHQKIIGNLGENLVCNWLSRSGLEVTIVDHTGIDIIAYNPRTKERLGITVKSRTRNPGKEKDPVNLFSYRKGKNDRQKVIDACQAFGCDEWIAVYVETTDYADLYLTSLRNYDAKYRGNKERVIDNWKMRPKNLVAYEQDNETMHLHMKFESRNWFKKESL